MITKKDLGEARNNILEEWGYDGKKVIKACENVEPFRDTFSAFLKHCAVCGGNWGGMLLTGIKELFPAVYEAIPEKMGSRAFALLCYILQLCGVDTEA